MKNNFFPKTKNKKVLRMSPTEVKLKCICRRKEPYFKNSGGCSYSTKEEGEYAEYSESTVQRKCHSRRKHYFETSDFSCRCRYIKKEFKAKNPEREVKLQCICRGKEPNFKNSGRCSYNTKKKVEYAEYSESALQRKRQSRRHFKTLDFLCRCQYIKKEFKTKNSEREINLQCICRGKEPHFKHSGRCSYNTKEVEYAEYSESSIQRKYHSRRKRYFKTSDFPCRCRNIKKEFKTKNPER